MAFRVIWAPSARLDMAEIAEYIAEHDVEAARRFVQTLFDATENLARFPEIGREVPEFSNPSIREVIKRPCRLVYRLKTSEKAIEIVRVWHSARGTPELE